MNDPVGVIGFSLGGTWLSREPLSGPYLFGYFYLILFIYFVFVFQALLSVQLLGLSFFRCVFFFLSRCRCVTDFYYSFFF